MWTRLSRWSSQVLCMHVYVVPTRAVYVCVCCPHTRCVCMCMLSSHTCPFIRCQCRRVEYHRGGVRQVDACTHGRDCTAGAQRTLVSAANTGCMCSNYSPDACFSCLFHAVHSIEHSRYLLTRACCCLSTNGYIYLHIHVSVGSSCPLDSTH
jgi:hypothetical protein